MVLGDVRQRAGSRADFVQVGCLRVVLLSVACWWCQSELVFPCVVVSLDGLAPAATGMVAFELAWRRPSAVIGLYAPSPPRLAGEAGGGASYRGGAPDLMSDAELGMEEVFHSYHGWVPWVMVHMVSFIATIVAMSLGRQDDEGCSNGGLGLILCRGSGDARILIW